MGNLDLVGTIVGPLRLTKPLRAGSHSELYEATDPRLASRSVVEILAPSQSSNPDAVAAFQERALSVARAWGPGRPNVLNAGSHGPLHWIEFDQEPGTLFLPPHLAETARIGKKAEPEPPQSPARAADPGAFPAGLVGATLGELRLEALLRVGSASAFYRAAHTRLRRSSVLEVLAPAWSGDPGAQAAFTARAGELASHGPSPGAQTIFNVGEAEGLRYLELSSDDGSELRWPPA